MANAYLEKQKKAQKALFDTAQDLMMQFDADIFTIVLHNRGFGAERMTDIIDEFLKLHAEYIDAFDVKNPLADYKRELLDREMRAVFGDKADPFEKRYPMVKEIRYDKPLRGGRTMMSDLKLNPCPFCGGAAELQHGQSGKDYITYYAVVCCTNCKASTRKVSYSATEPVSAQAEQKAANLWNRRWKRA